MFLFTLIYQRKKNLNALANFRWTVSVFDNYLLMVSKFYSYFEYEIQL